MLAFVEQPDQTYVMRSSPWRASAQKEEHRSSEIETSRLSEVRPSPVTHQWPLGFSLSLPRMIRRSLCVFLNNSG